MKGQSFSIEIFAQNADYASKLVAAGVDKIIVDWEDASARHNIGTAQRELRLRRESLEEVASVAKRRKGAEISVRVSNELTKMVPEIEVALACGVNEIWIPMIRSTEEVIHVLNLLNGRAKLCVMIETKEALLLGSELTALGVEKAFIGLLDLKIDLANKHIFQPLVDGTIDGFRSAFEGELGVAGITLPSHGKPVPQISLLAEMARLACEFGVGRNSFFNDIPEENMKFALDEIHKAFDKLGGRSEQEIIQDHARLVAQINSIDWATVDSHG